MSERGVKYLQEFLVWCVRKSHFFQRQFWFLCLPPIYSRFIPGSRGFRISLEWLLCGRRPSWSWPGGDAIGQVGAVSTADPFSSRTRVAKWCEATSQGDIRTFQWVFCTVWKLVVVLTKSSLWWERRSFFTDLEKSCYLVSWKKMRELVWVFIITFPERNLVSSRYETNVSLIYFPCSRCEDHFPLKNLSYDGSVCKFFPHDTIRGMR